MLHASVPSSELQADPVDLDAPTAAELAAGWSFVLANQRTIDRVFRAASTRIHSDRQEDVLQEVYVAIARRHRRYDSARCAPSTWVWWQVRSMVGKEIGRRTREPDENAFGERVDREDGTPVLARLPAPERHRLDDRIGDLLRDASLDERRAVGAVLVGLTLDEAADLGVDVRSGLRSLRRRAAGGAK
jgi:DNA-directed RNA polymerase specialized sigma24 family protein